MLESQKCERLRSDVCLYVYARALEYVTARYRKRKGEREKKESKGILIVLKLIGSTRL